MHPALTWKAAILSVKDLPEGTLVGYGGAFRAARPTRIAVLAANRSEYPLVYFAAIKLGAVLIPSSLLLTPADLQEAARKYFRSENRTVVVLSTDKGRKSEVRK